KEYRSKVVDYMIDGYKAGLTPNPDIMCNQEVKFKLFLQAALDDGADMIATGHYARIKHGDSTAPRHPELDSGPSKYKESLVLGSGSQSGMTGAQLLTGIDGNKDQSYFLYRVTEDALRHSLMPIGEYQKPQVRELAKKFGLATAEKKDSQGICFVGKVGIKEFLQQFVTTEPGAIIDQHNTVIGEHDGALFYTIGQRQGLHVGGGLPYYVVGKSMDKNEVYVTTDLQDARLWANELTLTAGHWINDEPNPNGSYMVRTRYRADLLNIASLHKLDNGNWHMVLRDEVRALTPGQSAVIYEGDRVVGGGIVVG
ncbi:MAG TPA: tRNA 2-thiouridine(34) synthase MnmA, partial [Candidatus Saccharimonadales bacterium]|nr:tRNA 2-thiouridine(34) synthase MnmA [Candidatus Saccharimonadales bacterium]